MTTSVDLPEGLRKAVDSELEKGYYASKSDLIRDAIRRLLEENGVIEEVRLSDKAKDSVHKARQEDERYTEKEIREKHGIES